MEPFLRYFATFARKWGIQFSLRLLFTMRTDEDSSQPENAAIPRRVYFHGFWPTPNGASGNKWRFVWRLSRNTAAKARSFIERLAELCPTENLSDPVCLNQICCVRSAPELHPSPSRAAQSSVSIQLANNSFISIEFNRKKSITT